MKNLSDKSEPAKNSADCTSNIGEAVDIAELLDRVAGDQDLLKHLIEIFLKDYPGSLQGIREAVDAADYDALHKSAHRLKGALGNFSAHAAFQYAEKLEIIGMSGDKTGAQEGLVELETELVRVREALELIAASKG
ncbi:MAG: Hpt domain-containing protein [Desulfomonile sp.]|jgi:HPt (histidine-containing phosphotransfer) domain-containing protein